MKTNFKQQRGSILIFSILILGVVVASALTLAKIFFPKVRSINDAVNSVVALYIADTATEHCLYEARRDVALANPVFTNGGTFVIASLSSPEVLITNNCSVMGSSFTFRATGVYRNVSRALEINQ